MPLEQAPYNRSDTLSQLNLWTSGYTGFEFTWVENNGGYLITAKPKVGFFRDRPINENKLEYGFRQGFDAIAIPDADMKCITTPDVRGRKVLWISGETIDRLWDAIVESPTKPNQPCEAYHTFGEHCRDAMKKPQRSVAN